MTRADIEAAAEEKYPLWTWHDDAQRYRQEGYIQGRLDQAEADKRIAEDAPGSTATGYYASNFDSGYQEAQNFIAAEIRKGVE